MSEGNGILETKEAESIPPPAPTPTKSPVVLRRKKKPEILDAADIPSETLPTLEETDAAREELMTRLQIPENLQPIFRKLLPEEIHTLEREMNAVLGGISEVAYKKGAEDSGQDAYARGVEAGRVEKQHQIESLPFGRILNVLGAATLLRDIYTSRAEDGSVRDLKGLGRAIDGVIRAVDEYERQTTGR
jgi:hypothetical protein